MGEHEDHEGKAAGEKRPPMEVEGAPDEEGISQANVAERVDLDPEEQLNRPDQPDATPDEKRQFDVPPGPTGPGGQR
jgi:hypothetical protein